MKNRGHNSLRFVGASLTLTHAPGAFAKNTGKKEEEEEEEVALKDFFSFLQHSRR